jgi:hypothetical protein
MIRSPTYTSLTKSSLINNRLLYNLGILLFIYLISLLLLYGLGVPDGRIKRTLICSSHSFLFYLKIFYVLVSPIK